MVSRFDSHQHSSTFPTQIAKFVSIHDFLFTYAGLTPWRDRATNMTPQSLHATTFRSLRKKCLGACEHQNTLQNDGQIPPGLPSKFRPPNICALIWQ